MNYGIENVVCFSVAYSSGVALGEVCIWRWYSILDTQSVLIGVCPLLPSHADNRRRGSFSPLSGVARVAMR